MFKFKESGMKTPETNMDKELMTGLLGYLMDCRKNFIRGSTNMP
jgi:hypothetical protein